MQIGLLVPKNAVEIAIGLSYENCKVFTLIVSVVRSTLSCLHANGSTLLTAQSLTSQVITNAVGHNVRQSAGQ